MATKTDSHTHHQLSKGISFLDLRRHLAKDHRFQMALVENDFRTLVAMHKERHTPGMGPDWMEIK